MEPLLQGILPHDVSVNSIPQVLPPAFNPNQLYIESDLQLRARLSGATSSEVDAFMQIRYGLGSFTELCKEHFPMAGNGPVAVLARQVPMPSVETLTCVLLCQSLGIRPLLAGFKADTFTTSSIDKSAAIKIRTVRNRRSEGSRFISEVKSETLTAQSMEALGGRALESIQTKCGRPLSEFHGESIRSILPEVDIIDTSRFFYDCLRLSNNRPEFCYLRSADGKCEKVLTASLSLTADRDDVRPPAHWYYPAYFALFLERMFILETYENSRGSVGAAKQLFQETSDELKAATGHRPRVLRIPVLSKEMLYINGHVLEEGCQAIKSLSAQCAGLCRDLECNPSGYELQIHALSAAIARKVLEYSGREH